MPKVTFGILALNAQPLLRYNLAALYPFAHQIIVVEGATQAARSLARPDGHSQDGTFEMLREFQRSQDPQGKLVVVTAQEAGYSEGFWPEKEEMSQAYATRASGDWLWQVDSDEFYQAGDMAAVLELLESQPEISGVSFPYIEFFGGFDSYITGEWHLYGYPQVLRIFKWGPGYRYVAHRPPRVLNAHGQDLHTLDWLTGPQAHGQPIYMYHYSYVFPKQAQQKVGYYSQVTWSAAFQKNQQWYEQQYLRLKNPLRLGELGGLQWLEPFRGQHPAAIQALRADLHAGRVSEPLRPQADIQRLLHSPWMRLQTRLARAFLWLYWPIRVVWKSLRQGIVNLLQKVK